MMIYIYSQFMTR